MLDELVAEAQESLGEREREALWVRGMSDEQIDRLRVGYSEQPVPLPGLGKVSDCFVFPLTNTLRQVKGIQVRPVNRTNKVYADYFLPGSEAEPVLYGLGEAMESWWAGNQVCLVEGVFDLPPIHRTFPATIATMKAGAAPIVIRLLRRMGGLVYLGWDNDSAGSKSRHNIQKYNPELQYHDIQYPKLAMPSGKLTKDPGDLWELWGTAKFAKFIASEMKG